MDRDELERGPGGKNLFARRTRCHGAHHLVEAQAELTPHATALVFEGRSLSYSELNRQADRLASDLQRQGVGPNTLVGHFFERGLEMVVGLLGILKAGGAYVPLAPDYPKDLLRFMLRDSGVGLLLSHKRLAHAIPEFWGKSLFLDGDSVADDLQAPVRQRIRANNLAYVIYTSGSTGRPKGVQISHRALVNLLISMRRRPGLSARDILAAVTTLSFDIAGLEILLPLTVGARCEIVSREVASDGARLASYLDQSGVTVMQATPTTWHMLLEAGWVGNDSLKVLCGGEAMSRGLADQLLVRCGSLWNMYGPTETTIWSTVERVEPASGPISLGQPIRRTQLYILDSDMNPVPPGQEGELYIGGAGLALGYLNRPELTAERFVRNPFGSRAGARLYKTGDLVRCDPDGRIQFLGRIDHQVKVRGFRIELGEIDAVLSKHPSVQRAVTLARTDDSENVRLVSYVVQPRDCVGDRPLATATDLRSYLAERLPSQMVPPAFVMLDALPLTPNGKVDRKALPAPDTVPARECVPFVAPRCELERKLASLWEDGFGLRPIGIDDDFFALGGHSLLAAQLATRIEKGLGQRFSPARLLRAPTIRLIAEAIKCEEPESSQSSLVEVQAGSDAKPPFFCLPGWTGIVDGLGAVSLRRLAQLLGSDQPVYMFQSLSSTDDMPGEGRIEDLAAVFVEDLLARFPYGPFLLGGYSHGAVVAFEMARQLAEKGHSIGLLILIDMWGVEFPIRLSRFERWKRRSLAEHWTRLKVLVRPPQSEPSAATNPRLQRFHDMIETYRQSLSTRHVPGRMVLFRASEPVPKPGFRFDEPYNGCGALADVVEVRSVPGDHVSLMQEPNIQALAKHLRGRIREALIEAHC